MYGPAESARLEWRVWYVTMRDRRRRSKERPRRGEGGRAGERVYACASACARACTSSSDSSSSSDGSGVVGAQSVEEAALRW